MESNENIEKIKAVRKLKHLTQKDMSEKLGYNDVKEYSRIETCEKRLTSDLMGSIAEMFEMSVIALLSFDEKMVFNHCTQDHSLFGNGNHFHEGNVALIAELKARVDDLKAAMPCCARS